MTDELRENIAEVESRLSAACGRAGRRREAVTLVAVTKLHPVATVRAGYEAGLRHFGENYAQELRDKQQTLSDLPGLTWHAIGPVQPKNAKYVARAATWFHALDRLDVAQELSKRREGPPLCCLVEVNFAGEKSKAGLQPEDAEAFIARVRVLPGLDVVGLTAMPPFTDDPEASRPWFRQCAALGKTLALPHLSMGTTGDFEVAVEEGATLVRVGTALFGERPRR